MEKCLCIVLVDDIVLHCKILAAKLIRKSLKLCGAFLIEGGKNLNGIFGIGQILALFKHTLHGLGRHRRPAAVFDERHLAIAKVALGEVIDERTHKGENISIVGGGCKHDFAITESILNRFCHIATRKVIDNDLGTSLGAELFGKCHNRLFGVAVNRGVGNHNSLFFGLVARPSIIKIDIIAKIFIQYRAVQGADDFNIKACRFFEERLHLRSVFANNTNVVATRFARPFFFDVESTEFSKAVGREKNLVGAIVGNDNLRPVYHRSGDKGQFVFSQIENVTLAHHNAAVGIVGTKEVLHHIERLCRGYYDCVGIRLEEVCNVCRVVGLHMLHHKIIGLARTESVLNVIEPLVCECGINGIHNSNLFIDDGIRIIRHAVGNDILTLKKIDVVVVYANILDVICNFHFITSCVL